VFSKNFQENLRVPIARSIQSGQNAAELKILAQNTSRSVFAEEMRSHDLVFLAILTIRVAFEANSMDSR
jgi:hypothetical protein